MFKKILLVFVITSFLAIIGSGESEEYNNYSPAYTLIPMPNEVIVNKGHPVSIDLYVSGLGMIKENKIILRIPPELLDSENPGQISGSIKCRGDNRTNFESKIETHSGEIGNMRIVLNECNFMMLPEEKAGKTTLKRAPILLSEWDNSDNTSLSESDNSYYAPIHVILNISDDAPTGDNYIYLVLTYADETKWYQDKEKIKIHVNNPVEQYRFYLLLVLTFITLLFSWLSDVTKKMCEWIWVHAGTAGKLFIRLFIVIMAVYILYLIRMSM